MTITRDDVSTMRLKSSRENMIVFGVLANHINNEVTKGDLGIVAQDVEVTLYD